MSLYFNESVIVVFPSDSYTFEAVGKDSGTYGLEARIQQNSQTLSFNAVGIPILVETTHCYEINWSALSRGEEGVTIQVDYEGDGNVDRTLTSDSELTAEEFQEVLEGDVTQDGLVDIFDLVTIVIAYGSTPSIISWDARCDLNGDNVIDVFDLAIVAANFGKEQTPPQVRAKLRIYLYIDRMT